MTPEQRQELLRIIEKGEEVSPEWARILFPPEKREYELVYHGKDAVIIADRMLPARAEERGIKLRKSFEGGVVGDESFHVYHWKNEANQKESSN